MVSVFLRGENPVVYGGSESDTSYAIHRRRQAGCSTVIHTIKSIHLYRLCMAIQVTRTCVGSIRNHRQICEGLDSLGDSASKIWNVARWTADRIWNATGQIPDEGTLKAYMKNQSC